MFKLVWTPQWPLAAMLNRLRQHPNLSFIDSCLRIWSYLFSNIHLNKILLHSATLVFSVLNYNFFGAKCPACFVGDSSVMKSDIWSYILCFPTVPTRWPATSWIHYTTCSNKVYCFFIYVYIYKSVLWRVAKRLSYIENALWWPSNIVCVLYYKL